MSVEAMAWALNVPVGGNAKVVLIGLANHAHPDGSETYPAHRTLARYAHCSVATVKRVLIKLEEDGWIRRDGAGSHGVVRWRLCMTERVAQYEPPLRSSSNTPPGSSPMSYEPPIEELRLVVGNGRGGVNAGTATALTEDGTGNENEKEKVPCWDLPPDDAKWEPTYSGLDPNALAAAAEEGVNWVDPPIGRVVLDFWRDLHWHMEAELTPSRQEAIKTALRHYPVRMVCRAIAAGLKDKWIQGEPDEAPHDKLETMIAVTARRDNVERLGNQVSEEELDAALLEAQGNRSQLAWWRLEDFKKVGYDWRRENRHRLQRDSQGRYQRYMKWLKQQEAAAA